MLRWMCRFSQLDKIQKEHIWEKIGVASIDEKMKDVNVRWFDHVKGDIKKRLLGIVLLEVLDIVVKVKGDTGRPKGIVETSKKDSSRY